MPYAGKTIINREIAQHCHDVFNIGWHWEELHKAVATCLAESKGSVGAWHDNLDADGNVVSRDCGLFQINIPANQIGSDLEATLRTESFDPDIYLPVVKTNIEVAWTKYHSSFIRNGVQDIRRWQPWVAYTSGWAMFNEWWVWHQDVDGDPIGPWLATGRYLQQAIRAIPNYHFMIVKDWDEHVALDWAKKWQGVFNVKGTLSFDDVQGVFWASHPPKPSDPPADGIGPRPVSNDGV